MVNQNLRTKLFYPVVLLLLGGFLFSCQEEAVEPTSQDIESTPGFIDLGDIPIGGGGDCVEAEGEIVTEERILNGFSGVDIDGPVTIALAQGSTQGVIIEAKQNLVPLVITEVIDDVLIVTVDGCIFGQSNIIVNVTIPDVASIDVAGAGAVSGQATISGDQLDIDINDSGSINLALAYDAINYDSGTSGISTLSGTVVDLTVNARGSTRVQAFGLQSTNCVIVAEGTSVSEVAVFQSLDATVSGLAQVTYQGTPSITQNVSFLGKLIDGN